MKIFFYIEIGPIGCNNNSLIDPIKAIAQRNRDTSSLGFMKIPFHLGINKCIPEYESSSWNELQAKSDGPKDNVDDKDPYPYPIPHDLAKLFSKLDDFVPCINAMDSASNSSKDTTNSWHTQLE